MYADNDIENIFNTVCDKITKGASLRSVLLVDDMPSSRTFYKWLESDDEKVKQYKEAMKTDKYLKNIRCNSNPKGSKAKHVNDYRRLNARKTNKKRFPNSLIYIIEIIGLSLYKIGVSNNVERRYKDINSVLPFESEIIYKNKINKAYDLEQCIHNKYISNHKKGEWFNLSKTEIKLIINKIELWQEKNIG